MLAKFRLFLFAETNTSDGGVILLEHSGHRVEQEKQFQRNNFTVCIFHFYEFHRDNDQGDNPTSSVDQSTT